MRLTVGIVFAVLLSAAGIAAYLHWPGQNTAVLEPITTAADPLQSAIALAENKGCKACHSLDGTAGIGPSWKDSYGSTRTFVDGSTLQVDDMYLRESMQQPAARVVAGYQNVMVAPVLSDQEVTTLVELIRQLKSGVWQ